LSTSIARMRHRADTGRAERDLAGIGFA